MVSGLKGRCLSHSTNAPQFRRRSPNAPEARKAPTFPTRRHTPPTELLPRLGSHLAPAGGILAGQANLQSASWRINSQRLPKSISTISHWYDGIRKHHSLDLLPASRALQLTLAPQRPMPRREKLRVHKLPRSAPALGVQAKPTVRIVVLFHPPAKVRGLANVDFSRASASQHIHRVCHCGPHPVFLTRASNLLASGSAVPVHLAPAGGLEPPTLWLTATRSTG